MDHSSPLTADTLLRGMRGSGALRRARVDRRGAKGNGRLIVAIGQIHPVLSGRFSLWTARHIGRTQAWIYRCCTALRTIAGIDRFGQEGFGGSGEARVAEHLLSQLRKRLAPSATAETALRQTAERWGKALRQGAMEQAADEAALLSGLAVLQAEDPSVAVFAIEDAAIHSTVGANIDALQRELERCQASADYRMAIAKGGKRLTPKEYAAVRACQALVRTYNRMLASPERDRAMFQKIVERSERQDCTVFVLGQAHRRSFLRLARRVLPVQTTFLWVTPPQLWWWQAMGQRLLAALLAILMLGALWQLRGF